ncbi:hypothetical protein [Dactylosporangium sp. CA-092794]|uniref:hypothetical protein n=1 Tax=Dactylosporangium sp. CA-092794 TaxID=3239929 RepID=UPI003D8B3340
MRVRRICKLATVSLLAALVGVAGAARPAAAASYVPISGGGSTLSYNAFRSWIGTVAQYGMRVDYERSGSSTGRAKFREGTLDETIDVDVPLSEGVLTMTAGGTVVMTDAVLRPDHTFESTGDLGWVTIDDFRDQTVPGWSVSGQIGDFAGDGHTFSGSFLGWTPGIAVQNPARDVVPGLPVAPRTDPGLKHGGRLAAAPAGRGLGTTVIRGDLSLKIPSSTQPGTYSATLTITALATA